MLDFKSVWEKIKLKSDDFIDNYWGGGCSEPTGLPGCSPATRVSLLCTSQMDLSARWCQRKPWEPEPEQTGRLTRSGVLQLKVLIRKLPPVDRLPSSSVVVGEIPPLRTHTCVSAAPAADRRPGGTRSRSHLTHELRDHPVEGGALVTEAVFSCAQRPEVLCGTDPSIRSSQPDQETQRDTWSHDLFTTK